MISPRDNVRVIDHPLVNLHLTRMRDAKTQSAEFRALVRRVATILATAATDDLELRGTTVRTPLTTAPGFELAERIAIVPILRAGLGLVDPLLDLIPDAEVWHLGLFRDEETAEPVEYYKKVPATNPPDVALVVDPMLATGGSASMALDVLRRWGVPRTRLVVLIAAPEGIAAVSEKFPETEIITAQVDDFLNDHDILCGSRP